VSALALEASDLRSELIPGRAVVAMRRRPCAYRSSFRLDELDVRLDDGSLLALVEKDLSAARMSATARAAKPAFLRDPKREADVYLHVLAGAGIGTAECHAVLEDDSGGCWLLLERIAGAPLTEIGDFEIWRRAAAAVGAAHERLERARARGHGLLSYDRDYFRIWPWRALALARGAIAPAARRALEAIAARYDDVVERLAGLPQTIVHGDLYASNVLIAGERVCFVDWELAGVGPGLLDVAALTSGSWAAQERAAMCDVYFRAAPRSAAALPDLRSRAEALEACRLHLALQWLGWSRDWSPPAHQRRDWLADALDSAERLGL
jgi:aminoglycoside phosphotransferase (APT) family kinase protein